MGTARRLATAIWRKPFRLRFWVVFAGILGFTSSALSLVDKHLSFRQAAILTVFSLAAALAASRKQILEAQVSVDDVLPEDIADIVRTRIECPCDTGVAKEASRLAQECYETKFTISSATFDSIRLKNPGVLAALLNDNGDLLGYFDVIPLKNAFAQLFIEGRVAEDQLRADDVYSISERANSNYLFISGLAVWSPDSFNGRRNANILVWALIQYLEHHYGSMQHEPLVIAVASTKEGDSLLRRFKLKVTTEPANRTDKHRLYSLKLDNFEIRRRLACLPDWSSLCALPWDGGHLPVRRGRPVLRQIPHYKLEPAI